MSVHSRCVSLLLFGATLSVPAKLLAAEPWTLHDAVGASESLKLGGSVRLRTELMEGQFRPRLDGDDHLLSLRSILTVGYSTGRLRLGAELIDSRAYLGDSDTPVGTSEVNALELVQAHATAELADAFGAGSQASLMVGRMTLELGSRRLVAHETFRNTTNGFTGARFDWRRPGHAATIVYVLPQQRLPDDRASIRDNEVRVDRESSDLRLWAGLYDRELGGGTVELYAIGLDERDGAGRPTRNRHLVTPGVRVFRDPAAGATDYEFEAMMQRGTVRATAAPTDRRDIDVRAWFAHAEIGHSFDGPLKPRVALEYDHASGDRASTRRFERFDGYYGSRRNDFGPTGIYGPLGRANISSPLVRVEIAPSKRWDAFAAYRAAWLDSRTDSFAITGVRDPRGRSGAFAAHQIEGRGRVWLLPKQLRLEVGAAFLLEGRFLESAPNRSGNGDTAYSYADLTASF